MPYVIHHCLGGPPLAALPTEAQIASTERSVRRQLRKAHSQLLHLLRESVRLGKGIIWCDPLTEGAQTVWQCGWRSEISV